jgi:eukaryotic-like serine/threonine-protein kinase
MADTSTSKARLFRFGPFEIEVRAGELRKHGTRIKLGEQAVRILLMLLEQPSEIVLREEIRLRLWPNDTIVEFDHGINAAIRKLREALSDSADNPRYVETVARRGYRFIAEVEKICETALPAAAPSHYRMIEKVGEGGMGVVYSAEDLNLGRMVAIKRLPYAAGELPDSVLRRFETEARAAAALNHPHICTIHGFENIDDQPAIVMELVTGETLASRLARGSLPRHEAITLGVQIAGALAEAHRNGIVHRDLKPGNIMLTRSGAKVLDFGLAKIERPPEGGKETMAQPEAVLGTMGFMSPEQAQGRGTDARTDIFSFGVVLYQTISGRRPFDGDSAASVIAAILERNPPPLVPIELDRIVRRCLAKNPDDRWQSAADLETNLKWLAEPTAATSHRPARSLVWATIAGLALLTIAALAWFLSRTFGHERPAMTLTIVPPPGATLVPVGSGVSIPEMFPDGSAVLYSASDGYWVRKLDSPQPRKVPGSEGRNGAAFMSPDSKLIALPVLPPFELKKVRMPDGAAETITPLPGPSRGGSWSDRGTILISLISSLLTVPASGGELRPVTMPESLKSGGSYYPQFLPGVEDFLFAFSRYDDSENGAIYLATLRDGKVVSASLLLKNQTPARYTPAGGGRILFVRGDNLYAQKLNRAARKLEGEAELVVQGVASQPASSTRSADFSVARDGTIAWRPGRASLSQLTVFDRQGNSIATVGPPGSYLDFVLSPDETQLLLFVSGTSYLAEVGKPGISALPKDVVWLGWVAGGSKLIGIRHGTRNFAEMSASGLGDVRDLRKSGLERPLPSLVISSDGRKLLAASDRGLFIFPLEGTPEETKPITVERNNGRPLFAPSFSQDGRWIIYGEGGPGGGIYVRPFPGPGPRRQIAAGGRAAVWRRDGKEIAYLAGNSVMSISVDTAGNELHFGAPRPLISSLRPPAGAVGASRSLAISHDGSKIFYLQGIEQPNSNMIHIKTGFFK